MSFYLCRSSYGVRRSFSHNIIWPLVVWGGTSLWSSRWVGVYLFILQISMLMYCDWSSRWIRCVPHHWVVRCQMWIQHQFAPFATTSILLQLSHSKQSKYKCRNVVCLKHDVTLALSGRRGVHVHLQPQWNACRKGSYICFEKNLFPIFALVSQRGHLWGKLHGSQSGCIWLFWGCISSLMVTNRVFLQVSLQSELSCQTGAKTVDWDAVAVVRFQSLCLI